MMSSNSTALINALFCVSTLCMALWYPLKPTTQPPSASGVATDDAALAAARAAEDAARAATGTAARANIDTAQTANCCATYQPPFNTQHATDASSATRTETEITYTTKQADDDSRYITLPDGDEGMQKALELGLIRPALESDFLQFNGKKDTFYLRNSYVILRPFKFPNDMYGAHSATFVLSTGVAYPRGELSHSTLYNMNDGTCRGIMCGH